MGCVSQVGEQRSERRSRRAARGGLAGDRLCRHHRPAVRLVDAGRVQRDSCRPGRPPGRRRRRRCREHVPRPDGLQPRPRRLRRLLREAVRALGDRPTGHLRRSAGRRVESVPRRAGRVLVRVASAGDRGDRRGTVRERDRARSRSPTHTSARCSRSTRRRGGTRRWRSSPSSPRRSSTDGVVTAGSSSQICDGAAAMLLVSEDAAGRLELEPRARFVSFGLAGVDPYRMLHGNPQACERALAKAGLSWDDMAVIEVNEAFASVVLQFLADTGLEERWRAGDVNPNGGGHLARPSAGSDRRADHRDADRRARAARRALRHRHDVHRPGPSNRRRDRAPLRGFSSSPPKPMTQLDGPHAAQPRPAAASRPPRPPPRPSLAEEVVEPVDVADVEHELHLVPFLEHRAAADRHGPPSLLTARTQVRSPSGRSRSVRPAADEPAETTRRTTPPGSESRMGTPSRRGDVRDARALDEHRERDDDEDDVVDALAVFDAFEQRERSEHDRHGASEGRPTSRRGAHPSETSSAASAARRRAAGRRMRAGRRAAGRPARSGSRRSRQVRSSGRERRTRRSPRGWPATCGTARSRPCKARECRRRALRPRTLRGTRSRARVSSRRRGPRRTRARESDRASRSRGRSGASTRAARSRRGRRERGPPPSPRRTRMRRPRTMRCRSSRTRARRSSARSRPGRSRPTRPGAWCPCARGSPCGRARRTSRPGRWGQARRRGRPQASS